MKTGKKINRRSRGRSAATAFFAPKPRALSSPQPDGHTQAPPVVTQTLQQDGAPMDTRTKEQMEQRFGQDFSQVRILTGEQAARSAAAIQARAYTCGNRIVFNKGEYRPESAEGQWVLAHELTHVLQQAGGIHRIQRLDSPAYYGSDNFDSRFRGVVFHRGDEPVVTLVMTVDFESIVREFHLDKDGHLRPEYQKKVDDFKKGFKNVIETDWSEKLRIKSSFDGKVFINRVLVYEVVAPTKGHASVKIHLDPPSGARSNAGEDHEGTRIANMKPGDEFHKEKKWTYKGKEMIFFQATASHEFGHLMGLKHVHSDNNDENAYGVTPEESADIMGRGSNVGFKNAEPFIKILRRFAKDYYPSDVANRSNLWVKA